MTDDEREVDESSDGADFGEFTEEQRQQALQGIRRTVLDGGRGLSQMTHGAVVSALCASACAPVVAAGLGAGAGVGAAVAVFGGIGASFLTDVVKSQVERLRRERSEPEVETDVLEAALRVGFEEALEAGSNQSHQLRLEMAEVLAQVDGIRVAHEIALEARNEDLARLIVRSTAELGHEIAALVDTVGSIGRGIDVSVQLTRMTLAETQKLIVELKRRQQESDVRNIRDTSRSTSKFAPGANPYLGLREFKEADSTVFWGRSAATADILQRAADQFESREPLVVMGSSGAGKSSLLRAGFLVAVADGAYRVVGSQTAQQCVVRPSFPEVDPLENLALKISVACDVPKETVQKKLDESAIGFASYVRSKLSENGRDASHLGLVLVIDQFEEIFAADVKSKGRERFIAAICALASAGRFPVASVVIAMRGDFSDRLTGADPLRKALLVPARVGHLTRDELREMIYIPAHVVGAELEPGLVDVILDDARTAASTQAGDAYDAGALPLLSEALRRLWEKQQELERAKPVQRLTLEAYRLAGRVGESVSRTADDVYELKLDARQRELARSLFLRLATVSSSRVTRRTEFMEPLTTQLGAGIRAVIGEFVAARLLVSSEKTVEVAHEVIFRQWGQLRSWIEEERAGLAQLQTVIDDAARWDKKGRPSYLLQTGPPLAVALRDLPAALDRRAKDEIEDGSADLKTAQEYLQASRLRRAWVRTGFAAIAVIVLVMALTAYTAMRDASQAERLQASLQLAEASREASLTDGPRAQLLAAAAWEAAETNEAQAAMTNSLMSRATGLHVATAKSGASAADPALVEFSGDGSTLVSLGHDGSIAVWNTKTWVADPIFKQKTNVRALDVSSDGGLVAVSNNGGLGIIDVSAGDVTDIQTGLTSDDVEFSPDNRYVAVSGRSVGVEDSKDPVWTKVWEVESKRVLATVRTPAGEPLSTSSTLFLAADSSVVIGGTTEDRMPVLRQEDGLARWKRYDAHFARIKGVPKYDVVRCEACSIYSLSATETPKNIVNPLKKGAGQTTQFGASGRFVAASYNGNGPGSSFEVHDLLLGRVAAVVGTPTHAQDFRLSPDGMTLVAAVSGGVQTWSLDEAFVTREVEGDLAISGDFLDPHTFAVAALEGVKVWDLAARPPRLVRSDPRNAVVNEGIAATRTAEQIEIWDARTGDDISTIPVRDADLLGGGLAAGRFVTDHRSTESDKPGSTLSTWDPETGELLSEFKWDFPDTNSGWSGLAIEPGTGDHLVAHNRTGNLYAFDTRSGRRTATLSGLTGDIRAFDISDIDAAVYAVTDAGLFKWNRYDDDSKATQLMSESNIWSVVKSPRGRYVYLSLNSEIVMWDTRLEAVVATVPLPEERLRLGITKGGDVLAFGSNGVYIMTPPRFDASVLQSNVCEQAGRGFTQEEESDLLTGLPVSPGDVCSG